MSVITFPQGLWVKRQDMGGAYFDLEFGNGDTGASQVARLGPPRLTCSLVAPDQVSDQQAAMWRSLIFALSGKVNKLAIWDMLNRVPRGTMRGSPTLASTAAKDTNILVLDTDQPGCTLKQGDWIGVNQGGTNRQLLSVSADAVADVDGEMTVTVAQYLRVDAASGGAVVWDRPTALMRASKTTSSWTSETMLQGGFNLDLIEAWE